MELKIVRKPICHLLLSWILLAGLSSSSVNDLHVMDGTTTAAVINGDIFFEIVEPTELQYTYRIRPAKDFGAPFNASFKLVHSKLVLANPIDACKTIENHDIIAGNVALVIRGDCSFVHKTRRAEEAGALAIIITEYVEGINSIETDILIEMIDDTLSKEVNIPSGFLLGRSGATILSTLKKLNLSYATINLPVNLTHVPTSKMKQPPWVSW